MLGLGVWEFREHEGSSCVWGLEDVSVYWVWGSMGCCV